MGINVAIAVVDNVYNSKANMRIWKPSSEAHTVMPGRACTNFFSRFHILYETDGGDQSSRYEFALPKLPFLKFYIYLAFSKI